MLLTGPQMSQLQEALLSAFPTRAVFDQMLLLELDTSLSAVAADAPLPQMIFQAMTWADAHGRLAELVHKAAARNPGNPQLRQAAEELEPFLTRAASRSSGTAEATTATVPAPAPVSRRELRTAIDRAFDASELAVLCADVQDALAARGIDLPVSVADVGGATKPVQVLNLITYLDRRGYLAELIAAVRAARPGLLDDLGG